jgi:hypothetical protein
LALKLGAAFISARGGVQNNHSDAIDGMAAEIGDMILPLLGEHVSNILLDAMVAVWAGGDLVLVSGTLAVDIRATFSHPVPRDPKVCWW